jgi:hypothetical protein
LEEYTSNKVDEDDHNHPAAIFARVLGMVADNDGKQPNTYPEKVSLSGTTSETLLMLISRSYWSCGTTVKFYWRI